MIEKRQIDNRKARAVCGQDALLEMLSMIGQEEITDHDVAEILTSYEVELRAMCAMFLDNMT